MKVAQIETQYGLTKLEFLYDMLYGWSVEDLVDELIEFYDEKTIADLMSNFDGVNEELFDENY